MTENIRLAGLTAMALLMGGTTALAQVGTLTGTRAIDEQIREVERDVADDLDDAQDAARFGVPEYRPGLSGSASLGYSGAAGDNEGQNLSIGARLRHAQGPMVQNFGVVLQYAEEDGSSQREDLLALYEANYYFNDQFYMFGLARVNYDGLADELDEDEDRPISEQQKIDAFVGIGPGYRVVNRPDMTWRVQAGLGISHLEFGDGRDETELGAIASSRFYWRANETVFLTNDTDILNSDEALRINNDFGINFRMTDAFSTRVSYLTDYSEADNPRTDHRLGVSLVYGF